MMWPAYTMDDVRAVPSNGYKVASFFSGCGGSSLGYKMAGFRVRYANEFVPAAQHAYMVNHVSTHLDSRDVRIVTPLEVMAACGVVEGELDLIDGSPPCSAFSTAGSREAGWGTVKKYSDTKQRVDDLFYEFVRIVEGVRPRALVAENVSGMNKGKATGVLAEVLKRLRAAGYRVSARVLDAQWLGVPQQRKRTIFVGFREDLGIDPAHPSPMPHRYSVADACPWLATAETSEHPPEGFEIDDEARVEKYAIAAEMRKLPPGGQSDKYISLVRARPDLPCPTITQTTGSPGAAGVCAPFGIRKFSTGEARRLCGFPDDFGLPAPDYARRIERLGRAVPPPMMARIAAVVRDRLLAYDGRTYEGSPFA